MTRRSAQGQWNARRGATVVEFAVIAPIVFLLLLGIIVGALGVFRYQEIAAAAREGARWASVHGEAYEQTTGKPRATKEDVIKHIKSRVKCLDGADIQVEFTEKNTVVVAIDYKWTPEVPVLEKITGSVMLSSRSEVPMSF